MKTSSALDHDAIEQHITDHNLFLRTSRLTLDDLNEYGLPMGTLSRAALAASEGFISEAQAIGILQESIQELKAIHADMNAAADREQIAVRSVLLPKAESRVPEHHQMM